MRAIRMMSRLSGIRVALAATVSIMLAGTAAAQTPPDPNPGALTFTGNFDVLPATPYIFRGIVQETDPKLTMWPAADLGFAFFSGDKTLKSATLNLGMWHSLHTGSSGLDNAVGKLHYEEDFYAALGLGFSKVTFTTTYTAYTSPNGLFGTVQELAFKFAFPNKVAPYFIVAQELGAVGADGGANKGTYVELGIGPSWPLAGGKATVAVPVKLGMSAKDYYENPVTGEDSKFGYLDVGILFTIPLSGVPANFGAWNFHVGGDAFAFGDTTKVFNSGSKGKGVFIFGFGVAY